MDRLLSFHTRNMPYHAFRPNLPAVRYRLHTHCSWNGEENVFQQTIVALQAHCLKSQRAVVISARNLLRCFGGSVALAASAAVQQNVLKRQLPERYKCLSASTYARSDYSEYPSEDDAVISEAYAKASRMVFAFMTPCAGLCLLAMFFVKDQELTRSDEAVKIEGVKSDEENKEDSSVNEKEIVQQEENVVRPLDKNEVKESSERDDNLFANKNKKVGQRGNIPLGTRRIIDRSKIDQPACLYSFAQLSVRSNETIMARHKRTPIRAPFSPASRFQVRIEPRDITKSYYRPFQHTYPNMADKEDQVTLEVAIEAAIKENNPATLK